LHHLNPPAVNCSTGPNIRCQQLPRTLFPFPPSGFHIKKDHSFRIRNSVLVIVDMKEKPGHKLKNAAVRYRSPEFERPPSCYLSTAGQVSSFRQSAAASKHPKIKTAVLGAAGPSRTKRLLAFLILLATRLTTLTTRLAAPFIIFLLPHDGYLGTSVGASVGHCSANPAVPSLAALTALPTSRANRSAPADRELLCLLELLF
jgi:hypothetical protein